MGGDYSYIHQSTTTTIDVWGDYSYIHQSKTTTIDVLMTAVIAMEVSDIMMVRW